MAKKNNPRKEDFQARLGKSPAGTSQGNTDGTVGDRGFREVLREFIQSPAVKNVAEGITSVLLTRLALRMKENYPKISDLIRENMDTLEGKFGEFRDTLQDSAPH